MLKFIEESKLDSLIFSKYRFTIEFNKNVKFREFHGSMLRGAFGDGLKNIVCIKRERKECNGCSEFNECSYPYIFDKRYVDNITILKPYVIEPEPKTFNRNTMSFNIILIGNVLKYLRQIIYSVREMGILGLGTNREKFRVIKIEAMDKSSKFFSVFDNITQDVIPHEKLTVKSFDLSHNNKITLRFLTQVRIEEEKEEKTNVLNNELNFDSLFSNLLRRVKNLSKFYCNQELSLPENELSEQSKKILTLKKDIDYKINWGFSSTQNKKVPFYGYDGDIEYSGDLEKLYPFLVLGEHLHIGKRTTSGLGRYKIIQ